MDTPLNAAHVIAASLENMRLELIDLRHAAASLDEILADEMPNLIAAVHALAESATQLRLQHEAATQTLAQELTFLAREVKAIREEIQ